MTQKIIEHSDNVRNKLHKGIKALATAVAATLGPRGRNVVLEKVYGSPAVTKDGVSVAKEIFLKDKIEDIGAQMVKEAAIKTSDVAGDGTTTATVLAEQLYSKGLKYIMAGTNPISLKRGIDLAVQKVIEGLSTISKDISNSKEIAQVGTISANNDPEIGNLIAEAMEGVGKDGVILVEESRGIDTTLEFVEGMQFDRGFESPYFDAENTGKVTYNNPYLLLVDGPIDSMKDLLPVLEKAQAKHRPLIIIAEEFRGDVLPSLVVNYLQGRIQAVAIKSPDFGSFKKESLQDIAVLTGATLASGDTGVRLLDIKLADLGTADKVVVSKYSTTISEGAGSAEAIAARIEAVKNQVKDASSDYEESRLHRRIAKLAGGIAILKVGAATETAIKEKKDRVEDAVHATKAAVEEGIVPGGGTAYFRAYEALDPKELDKIEFKTDDERFGFELFLSVLTAPLIRIALNAGEEIGHEVVANVKASKDINYGFNALTLKYGDLVEQGIIDPSKVVRVALQNAAEVAGLMLTTEVVIATDPEAAEKLAGHPGMR